jgi:hypothetical protein
MSESREQAQMRQHLSEMRRAVGGLGRDFAIDFKNLDDKIEELGSATSKDAKYLAAQIQDDFANLGRSIDAEIRALPDRIAAVGDAIGSGAARAGAATRDAMVAAGHQAKESTKNALATAAGVKRTPIREWHTPEPSDSPTHEQP